MVKILVLEDDIERISQFRKCFIGDVQTTYTDVSTTAIERLKEETYDMLFLDHDLGGKTMVESGPNTGYEVAQWLEQNPDRIPNQIIIHSLNPVGQVNMQKCLPSAMIIPFPILIKKLYHMSFE